VCPPEEELQYDPSHMPLQHSEPDEQSMSDFLQLPPFPPESDEPGLHLSLVKSQDILQHSSFFVQEPPDSLQLP
jgi:hypothetical protein